MPTIKEVSWDDYDPKIHRFEDGWRIDPQTVPEPRQDDHWELNHDV